MLFTVVCKDLCTQPPPPPRPVEVEGREQEKNRAAWNRNLALKVKSSAGRFNWVRRDHSLYIIWSARKSHQEQTFLYPWPNHDVWWASQVRKVASKKLIWTDKVKRELLDQNHWRHLMERTPRHQLYHQAGSVLHCCCATAQAAGHRYVSERVWVNIRKLNVTQSSLEAESYQFQSWEWGAAPPVFHTTDARRGGNHETHWESSSQSVALVTYSTHGVYMHLLSHKLRRAGRHIEGRKYYIQYILQARVCENLLSMTRSAYERRSPAKGVFQVMIWQGVQTFACCFFSCLQ